MKKIISLFLSILMVMLLMVGCAQDTGDNTKQTTDSTDVESDNGSGDADEIKGTLSIYGSKDGWKDQCALAAQSIEEKYGIKIDLVTMPNEDVEPVISTKLVTNDPPDIFISNAPQCVIQYNATETCEALDNEPWVERLAAPELLRYTEDNHIYAMPTYTSATFFGGAYYNKKLMTELGYDNPQPKTFQEFMDICENIKNKGVVPIYMTDADAWTTQVWTTVGWAVALSDQKDTIYNDLLTNKIKFSEIPEMVTILQQLQELYNKGYVNENHASQTYDTAKAAIAEEEAVMAIQGEWFENDLNSMYPDVELGSFAIPFLDKDMIAVGAYVTGMYVPKGGQVELAKEFLNYWSSEEVMGEVYKKHPSASAFKDLDGGDLLPAQEYLIKNYVETGKYTNEFDAYFDVARPIMEDYLFGGIVEVTLGKAPKDVLEAWDERYYSFMKDKGMEGFAD